MSLVGRLLRTSGIYDHLRQHFVETLVIPFATKGQIGLKEANFLGKITRDLTSDRPIIEIGTLFGYSTKVIAINKKEAQRLLTVDKFSWNPCGFNDKQHKYVTSAVLSAAVKDLNVELIHVDKEAFYKTYESPRPAMVFLDANHSYASTLADIQWALSLKADVICGHDFSPDMPGVVQAVQESGGVVEIVDTMWVLLQ